jgi:hypothetical protein
VSGPLPTHFRWLWYLVGLAGMVLSVIGILAILGSAADLGILIPLVVVGAIVIGYVVVRFKRSIDAAVAAAPSRQAATADPTASSPAADGGTVDPDRTAPGASAGSAAATPTKPTGDQPRTSRR